MIARRSRSGRCLPVRCAPRAIQARCWPRTTRGCAAIVESLGPLAGRRILDLGCGKGRFARALWPSGRRGGRARPVRGDARRGADRGWIASARRRGGSPSGRRASTASWPSRSSNTWRPRSLDDVCGEVRRVLRPGGTLRRRRQERVLAERPAALAAERGREVDRRAPRSLDVFAARPGARALVPAGELRAATRRGGSPRSGSYTSSRRPSRGGFRFSTCPARDSSCSGRLGRREAPRDRTLFADARLAAAPACGRRRRAWS